VEGDDNTTFDDMVRMDLKYVENWSLVVDLKVLLKTARVVFRRLIEPLSARASAYYRSRRDLRGETS
jgi:lipopolysaccharide/colanic/teichoic acid biosynthesis glycosyltransferase